MKTTKSLIALAKEHNIGGNWYDIAQSEIEQICSAENWNIDYFTSILAITSPRVSVRRNIRIALHYVHNSEFLANVLGNVRRSVAKYESEGIIGGQKVNAFRRALLGDNSAIVLDVHMARILGVQQKEFDKLRIRKLCENAIKRVASAIGETPRNTQSILWHAQKLRVGENPELFPIVSEYLNFKSRNYAFPLVGTISEAA